MIGFVGWGLAVVPTVGPGGTVFACFFGSEWIVLAVFAIMPIVGLLISIMEVKRD